MTTTTENVRKLPDDLEFLTPQCPICAEHTDAYPDGLQCDRCGIAWDKDGTNPERIDPDAKQCPSLYTPPGRCCSDPKHANSGPKYRCWMDAGHDGDHHSPDAFYGWSTAAQSGEATP